MGKKNPNRKHCSTPDGSGPVWRSLAALDHTSIPRCSPKKRKYIICDRVHSSKRPRCKPDCVIKHGNAWHSNTKGIISYRYLFCIHCKKQTPQMSQDNLTAGLLVASLHGYNVAMQGTKGLQCSCADTGCTCSNHAEGWMPKPKCQEALYIVSILTQLHVKLGRGWWVSHAHESNV